ncbi:histidine ammonia-lyase [Anaeramoeba flamelloides]|uniref:Histidine ammonia-lyase n=1 Tax=Anaeramoeba flamelloides TaxID=1746091 RepID=A0ABQ8YCE8_9EUKA|nr:histidine ammonia-lyase [Anaeramoeba flamelloides]
MLTHIHLSLPKTYHHHFSQLLKKPFSSFKKQPSVCLDGNSLSPQSLFDIGYKDMKLGLSESASEKVKKSRECINQMLNTGEVVYGLNTGFGVFSSIVLPPDELELLQYNLIRSHSVGVGEPLTVEQTRMLFALRINVLAKGHSGISFENLKHIIKAFNLGVLPKIPSQGSVGASGDLAPLAHLALSLLGEGEVWNKERNGFLPSNEYLSSINMNPLKLGAKEGLALINGTQLITTIGTEALIRSERLLKAANIVSAMTFQALRGNKSILDKGIHELRPHEGQIKVANTLRGLIDSPKYPSEILDHFPHAVQDAYTLRCIPQVHGVVQDLLKLSRKFLATEINSATDNPIVFPERMGKKNVFISGGNFHGEYPAKACDMMKIAIQEIATMSERRIERLVNKTLSGPNIKGIKTTLPAFLVKEGGLNSGFMIAQYTAAALASENKVLVHPSSSDTIPTSMNQEDHVSMGTTSARHALQVVKNIEYIVAIELLAACQALEFLKPYKPSKPIQKVYQLVRKLVEPWDKDRYFSPDIEVVAKLIRENQISKSIEEFF